MRCPFSEKIVARDTSYLQCRTLQTLSDGWRIRGHEVLLVGMPCKAPPFDLHCRAAFACLFLGYPISLAIYRGQEALGQDFYQTYARTRG